MFWFGNLSVVYLSAMKHDL